MKSQAQSGISLLRTHKRIGCGKRCERAAQVPADTDQDVPPQQDLGNGHRPYRMLSMDDTSVSSYCILSTTFVIAAKTIVIMRLSVSNGYES